jgi:hypothetical protein
MEQTLESFPLLKIMTPATSAGVIVSDSHFIAQWTGLPNGKTHYGVVTWKLETISSRTADSISLL